MLVRNGDRIEVADGETVDVELDASVQATSVTVEPLVGEASEIPVSDNKATIPFLPSPDSADLCWIVESGGRRRIISRNRVSYVSSHYFELEDLRDYGDGKDDFSKFDDDALARVREQASSRFEKAARRSFVRRVGTFVDRGIDSIIDLPTYDAVSIGDEGYMLISDCQALRVSMRQSYRYPRIVPYTYGLDEIPQQVSACVLTLAAYMLRPSGRPAGATSESTDAGYIRYTVAGRDGATDLPEVNAVAEQFGRERRRVW